MHMCIAFFVYLHLPASALPTLRARTRGFASAHFRPCERALSALRVRTLGPVSAHSRACECALSTPRVRTHFSTPTHMCVDRIVGRVADMLVFEKKNQHSCIFLYVNACSCRDLFVNL